MAATDDGANGGAVNGAAYPGVRRCVQCECDECRDECATMMMMVVRQMMMVMVC